MTVPLIAVGVTSFFRSWFVFKGAQEGFAVLLKEKKQKFKKEGMLPPAGHTPGPPPLSFGPLRFLIFAFKNTPLPLHQLARPLSRGEFNVALFALRIGADTGL